MSYARSFVSGLILLGISAMLSITGPVSAFAQGSDEPTMAPENPAFVDYLYDPGITMQALDTFTSGLVPEPIDLSFDGDYPNFPVLKTSGMSTASVSIPTSFDLRTQSKLTSIKNQGSCGSCWAFASYGSLESYLMPTEALDFSENNLKNNHGFDIASCSGGNRSMSVAYLARWNGPVYETDDPYMGTSPANLAARRHVHDVVYLPTRTGAIDNDAIKQAVMVYGAVYTTYYHSDTYYNSTTGGYHYNGSANANHAVCIVGWDDNYSAGNFRVTPAGNGAFIMRNSWGTGWGKSGYFYMSYYDTRLGKTENAVFMAESASNYDGIYQYDTLGWVSSTGYGSSTAWYANVFTATANTNIAASSTYFGGANASYELYLYLSPTNGPIGGTLGALKTGTVDTAGYHTIRFSTPIPVSAGQKFSVVIKSSVPGYSYPIPLERPYSGYASAATASSGQSYMSSNGTSWTDVAGYSANTNVCLKAFTTASSAPAPTAGALSVSSGSLASTGAVGGPFSPSSTSYTLTNTGGSSINWTASKQASWIGLSSTSGTIAAGASATVTVSISSGANTLAAGSYSDSITFTNTTNGTGNTTRSVSLTVSASQPTAGSLSVSSTSGLASSGKAGGPFSPSSVTYTLTNSGGGSINWTASKTASWTSLSATAGTLAAGASATVTVSISSAANSLSAGTYSGTVSFTNSTNGTGNTSRAVSLTVSATSPTPTPSGDYAVQPTTYSWIDPSAHKRLYLWTNSASPAQVIPFAFNFYGKPYSSIYIGSNGLIGFASSGMTISANTSIPRSTTPNAIICPFWDYISMSYGSIRIGTTGVAPNRKVVISWVEVAHSYSLAARFSFQVILCEGTNEIVFQYKNVSPTNTLVGGGKSATIGIENETGTKGVQRSYNTTGAVANNTALRFYPQAITTYNRYLNSYRR